MLRAVSDRYPRTGDLFADADEFIAQCSRPGDRAVLQAVPGGYADDLGLVLAEVHALTPGKPRLRRGEQTKVFNLHLPASLHAALTTEARERGVSAGAWIREILEGRSL
jgi:hypothetical protein